MNPIVTLVIALLVVVGGITVLRLHAFLALIIAALIVAALGTPAARYQQELRADPFEIASISDGGREIVLTKASKAPAGAWYELHRLTREGSMLVARMQIHRLDDGRAVARLATDDDPVEVHEDDLLVPPASVVAARKLAGASIGDRVAAGFGVTAVGVGILIAMAAIIGKCLLDSGGAERIVLSLQRLLGEKRTPQAFVASGFILGIPVYADTVFYLLLPLAKAMWVHTRRNYLLYVLCIVTGATMTHSLVPPTPGPLLVANELNVDVGVMMLGGIIVGICTVTVGYFYSRWANRRWEIPLRPSAELTQEQIDAIAVRDVSSLPSLWLSLLPILLPVVLIAGAAVVDELGQIPGWLEGPARLLVLLGEKNLALTIAAAASILLLIMRPGINRKTMADAMQSALLSAGIIILITSSGGALGKMLQQTGIADTLATMMPTEKLFILPIAFALTVLVRTAQGSATVSMITAVGIVGPFAAAGDLGYHPVYLALAIGCGSKPGMWMNDSGFWVISKMAGLTEVEMLKTAAAVLTVMGFTGLVVTMLGAWLLPLV